MNIPELCIRRPVMTTLLMTALLVFGLAAYPQLPVNELPNVDFPTISISASLPGASPETMASAVATPLEGRLSTIAGISSMSSTSALGSTSITLSFELDRNIDAAAQDVQAAISSALRQLPREMSTPPTFRKVNPADAAILYLAMSSSTLPLTQVDEYAETELAQQLSMIDGVAQVNVYGSQKYAVRISVNPDRLAAAGIGIDQVQNAIADANVNQSTGSLYGRRQQLPIRSDGQLLRAGAYNDVVVAYRNGAPVHVSDIRRAHDSVQNDQRSSSYNGKQAIVLAIQRQPGANTVTTVDRIKAVLPAFRAGLPPSITLDTLYDRSQSIRESVDDVQFTLLLAGALVYSLDNLSLLALTLAVGFVVDDAIVMLENIVRHMEAGVPPYQAALKGAGEVGFTIFSMTLSLIAVFIPVMFMGGIVGRLFHEFAVVISVAILISGIVAITLTPMLCSRFVKAHDHDRKNWLVAGFDRGFSAVQRGYAESLRWCMERPRLVLAGFGVSLLATALLFYVAPKDFIPAGDSGQLRINTEGPEDVSFDGMLVRQQQLVEIVAKDPNIAGYMSTVGAGGPRSTINNGSILLLLKPANERRLGPDGIIQELRPKLATVAGIRSWI